MDKKLIYFVTGPQRRTHRISNTSHASLSPRLVSELFIRTLK